MSHHAFHRSQALRQRAGREEHEHRVLGQARHLRVTEPYISILGQTAPGGGILLRDAGLRIKNGRVLSGDRFEDVTIEVAADGRIARAGSSFVPRRLDAEGQPLPVVSGNVSFYNQSSAGSAILPSPIVCCIGRVDNEAAGRWPRLDPL